MNDEMVRKLHDIFSRKMEEVYEKTNRRRTVGSPSLEEFNAWQNHLNNTLSLRVIDIEEGGRPGVVRLRGGAKVVRIMNPSNAAGRGREFIVIPYEAAEKILMFGWIPDDLRGPNG